MSCVCQYSVALPHAVMGWSRVIVVFPDHTNFFTILYFFYISGIKIMICQIVSMRISPTTNVLYKNVANIIIRHKTSSDLRMHHSMDICSSI